MGVLENLQQKKKIIIIRGEEEEDDKMGEGEYLKRMGNGFCNFWVFLMERIDNSVSNSRVGKYFKLECRKTSFTTEFRAGTATFLTRAYILSVNATIFADSGGTCSASDCWVSANQTTPDLD